MKNGRNITLVPLSPKKVFEDQLKMVRGKQKCENEKKNNEKAKKSEEKGEESGKIIEKKM